MTYLKARLISRFLALAGAFLFLVGQTSLRALFYLGIAMIVAALLIAIFFLKCSNCGARIPDQIFTRVTHCPHCGHKVD